MPVLKNQLRPEERVAPRSGRRAITDFLILTGILVFVGLMTRFVELDHVQVIRGAIGYSALAVIAFRWVRTAAWLPGMAVAFLLWLFGTDYVGDPLPWAIPLQLGSSVSAWLVTCLLVVVAVFAYSHERTSA